MWMSNVSNVHVKCMHVYVSMRRSVELPDSPGVLSRPVPYISQAQARSGQGRESPFTHSHSLTVTHSHSLTVTHSHSLTVTHALTHWSLTLLAMQCNEAIHVSGVSNLLLRIIHFALLPFFPGRRVGPVLSTIAASGSLGADHRGETT